MRKLATLFTQSRKELKSTRTITLCAMMGALAIVLRSFSIEIGPDSRIGFATIPNMLVAFLFGPSVGCLFNGSMDILKYLLNPQGQSFMPGLTLVTMLAGCIYGCFFYQRPIRLWRSFLACFVVSILCNIVLNTWCLSWLIGKGFWILLPKRVLQNLITWPAHSLVFYYIAQILERAGVFRRLGLCRTR